MNRTTDVAKRFIPPARPTDDVSAEPILEILQGKSWIVVEADIWGSWTGLRRRNGEDYHGRVRYLDADRVYRGYRVCPCRLCQADADPAYRPN